MWNAARHLILYVTAFSEFLYCCTAASHRSDCEAISWTTHWSLWIYYKHSGPYYNSILERQAFWMSLGDVAVIKENVIGLHAQYLWARTFSKRIM